MSVPLMCIALLAFLCIALGFSVSMARSKQSVMIGNSTDPEDIVFQRIRAHGNTVEYVPILALLIYILSQSPQPAWVIWLMALVTACRYLIVAGLIFPKSMADPNPMRFVGALGTYVFGFGLVAALGLQAIS
ncbi:MAG: MAPEG family protein [Halioglobus sp.]